jgi:hypothetical protein
MPEPPPSLPAEESLEVLLASELPPPSSEPLPEAPVPLPETPEPSVSAVSGFVPE